MSAHDDLNVNISQTGLTGKKIKNTDLLQRAWHFSLIRPPYSCLVDWSLASTSASLSLSLRSSSWLLANSSWSFVFSVLAFSHALARVFSFCTPQQQKGISSVTGIGSECFGDESAGCDCGAPSSRLPVVALIQTLLSPALPVSPANASPQLHSPTYGGKDTDSSNKEINSCRAEPANNSSQHTFSSSTFSAVFHLTLLTVSRSNVTFLCVAASSSVVLRNTRKSTRRKLITVGSSVEMWHVGLQCEMKTCSR